MFSGIIEKKAKIIEIKDGVFEVENIFKKNLKQGISIAHDGACMTILESNSEKYSFFVMQESIKKTNYKTKKVGDFFNIEGSLKLSDTMDGHFVSGHVDTTGEVIDIKENKDGSRYYFIKYDESYNHLLIEKGSITINGVSLTVVNDNKDNFSVSIIPHTWEITNIGDFKIGSTVNLEFDILGKYIYKLQSKKIKNV